MKTIAKISTTSIRFLAASAIAFGLVPLCASAQTMGNRPHVQYMHGTALPPHLKALNLSQEQKEKLQAIEAAHQEQMARNASQIRTNKIAERELVEAPVFDEQKAEKLASQDAKIMEENTLVTLRFRHQVYQLLTPEQRTKFKEIRPQQKNR